MITRLFPEKVPDPAVIRGAIAPTNDRKAIEKIQRNNPHLAHPTDHQTAFVVPKNQESFSITHIRDSATTLSDRPLEEVTLVRTQNPEGGQLVNIREPLPTPDTLEGRIRRPSPERQGSGREPTPIRPLAPISQFHGKTE